MMKKLIIYLSIVFLFASNSFADYPKSLPDFAGKIGEFTFIIQEIKDNKIRNIIICIPDEKDNIIVITSPEGRYNKKDNENIVIFNLYNGSMYSPKVKKSDTLIMMKFDSYSLNIPLEDLPKKYFNY